MGAPATHCVRIGSGRPGCPPVSPIINYIVSNRQSKTTLEVAEKQIEASSISAKRRLLVLRAQLVLKKESTVIRFGKPDETRLVEIRHRISEVQAAIAETERN